LPWLYTPGDNDWTDCHIRAGGRFNPPRAFVVPAQVFTLAPVRTPMVRTFRLGCAKCVAAVRLLRENARFALDGIARHRALVGSDNGLIPARIDVDIAWWLHERNGSPRCASAQLQRWPGSMHVRARAGDQRARRGFSFMPTRRSSAARTMRGANRSTHPGTRAGAARAFARRSARTRRLHWYLIDTPFADLPRVVRMQVPSSPFVGWVKVTVPREREGQRFLVFERGTTRSQIHRSSARLAPTVASQLPRRPPGKRLSGVGIHAIDRPPLSQDVPLCRSKS